ncbi:ribosomal protein S20 [Chlamydia ibidis]|uniref:Small ribosomal subunit protein bS20 n=2 Tax=Chlamydia ibidis TaxID=1405396 RepID=S7J2N0_9CHLA|nr:30S ribosomal protein S20 [Chlamydia ibidis]EPP34498.1 ribosomal protein S20 [Chlamydia ibidis]EQM63173.1 ribosomal protein S20 [Chlamydia ibidis 10-1398/6]
MAPKKATKKTGPQKRPSAEKRVVTSKKRCLINQSFKSKVKTMMKRFEAALKAGNQEGIVSGLQLVHSMADKAVKRGIFKSNKAARVKSRATLRANAKI